MNEADAIKYLKIVSVSHYVYGAIIIPSYMYYYLKIIMSPLVSSTCSIFLNLPLWVLICFLIISFIFQLSILICVLVSGRYLAERKNYLFSVIIACLECLITEYGIVLGVITLVVLSQESVKNLYNLN